MITRFRLISIPLALLLLFALGCAAQDEATSETPARAEEIPGTAVGPVLQTMESGGYTYVELDTAQGTIWAAGPVTKVQVGQVVRVGTQMPMSNFHSESLNRDFDTVYFANALTLESANAAGSGKKLPPEGHTKVTPVVGGDVSFDGIAPADYTVAGLYAKSGELDGQTVKVRGRVVKALNGIMNRNWLHVQDGTGEGATQDLVVTTDATAEAGQMVLVTAKVALDQDFGMGYQYDLLLEDAQVQVEGD